MIHSYGCNQLKIEIPVEKAQAAKIVSLAAPLQVKKQSIPSFQKSISTSCTCVFGERRMNDHHPFTSKQHGNRIEVVQTEANQKQLYK